MSKRSVFTTITPLPAGITRQTVMETLYSHVEMIDLNPLVEERHPIKAPPKATAEEFHCQWYELTDKISYLPGGIVSGKVTYQACFHNLANGLQTHVYAPMGLDIKNKWTLGGTLPGEPTQPVEIGQGIPMQGLYLREDVDMKCNVFMTTFVRKTLKKAHSTLVARLLVKAQLYEAASINDRLSDASFRSDSYSEHQSPPLSFSHLDARSPHMSLSHHGSIARSASQSPLNSPGFPSAVTPPSVYGNNSLVPDPLTLRGQRPMSGPARLPDQGGLPYASPSYPGYGAQMDPAFAQAMRMQQHASMMSSRPVPYELGENSYRPIAPFDFKGTLASGAPPPYGVSSPPSIDIQPVELPTGVELQVKGKPSMESKGSKYSFEE